MAAAVTPADLWRAAPLQLVGASAWPARVEAARQQILQAGTPLVLIAEPDPIAYLTALLAGLSAGSTVALANPGWGERERAWLKEQISPGIVFGNWAVGEWPQQSSDVSLPWANPTSRTERANSPLVLVPTGGTTGQPRFVVHTWETLTAAARGFLAHFERDRASAYCVLPLYHVSGLMQVVRTWISGGELVVQPFKQLLEQGFQVQPGSDWFISLVPTQLQRLLNAGLAADLAGFAAILLGGGPPWPDLLARAAALPLAPTYGMSETAAQVATLTPMEFAAGYRSSGRILPHAQIEAGTPSQPSQLRVRASSLALGYWGDSPFGQTFLTDDVGYLDAEGHLHVLGRSSEKIITGGENVFPAEVEAALRATGLVVDVCVVGLSDDNWGQAVAALYVPCAGTTLDSLQRALRGQVSGYKVPKVWKAIAALPRNAQGKLNRQQVVAHLTSAHTTGEKLA